MNVSDVVYIILKTSYDNYDELFNDEDIKEYIKSAMDYILKRKEFFKLVKSNDSFSIHKLQELSKELTDIRSKLEYFCKLENIQYEGDYATIAYLILKYKNNIFTDKNVLNINNELGEKLFISINNYARIIEDFEIKINSVIKDNKYIFKKEKNASK